MKLHPARQTNLSEWGAVQDMEHVQLEAAGPVEATKRALSSIIFPLLRASVNQMDTHANAGSCQSLIGCRKFLRV